MTTDERLEKVEQELKETKAGLAATKRCNRWVLGCGAILVLGCLTMAATPGANPIIRANMFALDDDNGKNRAALFTDNDGPTLALRDENGKVRAQVFVDKKGPMLALSDKNENHQAMMTIDKDGPMLTLYDNSRNPRVILTVNKLTFYDANGKSIWKAP